MIRRLIGFILSVIVAAILFILLIWIFPSRKKSVDIVNMSYIFIDTDWTEYNIFEPVHWSAIDWSFLFWKNDESNDEDTVEETKNTVENTMKEYNVLWNIDYVWDDEASTWVIYKSANVWDTQELSWLNPNNPFNLPEWAIEKPAYKDCETPRWVTLKHKESILAYQQRTDVPDICNVQRRTCNNWVLDWTFTQPACDERVFYSYWNKTSKQITSETSNVVSYTRNKVISYNDKSVQSELIQPSKFAKNEKAEFDENWKLKTGVKQPITDRQSGDEWLIVEQDSKEQVNVRHYNCQAPWWEIVQHWQFVRAYELPFWFTNASCRVELRLCVDWELMWSYTYNKCQYLDVTYEEYSNVYEPTTEQNWEHEITDKKKQWFWQWLRNLFD